LRIAHLSDLHLHVPGAIRPSDLASRRLFGAANLVLRRRALHSPAVARAAVRAAAEAGADHCVVTGDLTNLALDAEFDLAAEVLAPLGGWERVTVIPGNHDYYTPGAVRAARFERRFGPTLWRPGEPDAYPAVKDVGEVRIVAVRTAMIAPPLCSFGEVGEGQLGAVRRAVEGARAAGRFVIVALHHNLHRRGFVSETIGRLLDRDAVRATLAEAGADLVLQGHDHRARHFELPRPGGGAVRVANCGSSSLAAGGIDVYEIAGGAFTVERWENRGPEGRLVRAA